jgi:hypothetical protein
VVPASKLGVLSTPPSVSNEATGPEAGDDKQLYIAQSGRSLTLHLMLSKFPEHS